MIEDGRDRGVEWVGRQTLDNVHEGLIKWYQWPVPGVVVCVSVCVCVCVCVCVRKEGREEREGGGTIRW